MRGTVVKRGTKWQAMWYTHHKIDGKPERKTKSGFLTKREAERFLRQKLDEVESTMYTDSEHCTLGAYLLKWLDEHSRNIEYNTIRGYRINIEKHINPVIGSVPLHKLSPSDVDKLLDDMDEKGLSKTTQKYAYLVLNNALNHAVKRRIIPYNVVTCVDKPKKETYVPTILDQEQMQTLKNHLYNTDIFIPIFLCMSLGLRRGEMLGVKWSDINFNSKVIHIQRSLTPNKKGYICSDTKNDSSNRFLQIPDVLYSELCKLRDEQIETGLFSEDGYINLNANGEVISASMLQKEFKKALTDCKLPSVRLHDLRHSFATLMLTKDVPLKVTSQILGHSSIGTTADVYTRVQIHTQTQATDVVSDVFK